MSSDDVMAAIAAVMLIVLMPKYGCVRAARAQQMAVIGMTCCWPTGVVEPEQWETGYDPATDDTRWTCAA